MKTRILLPLLLASLALAGCSHPEPKKTAAASTPQAVRLTLLPQDTLRAGKSTTVLAKLNLMQNAHIVTDSDLQTVHTEKFHLLVIDPTFTDYQHIHPTPTKTPGIYSFSFTPKFANGYRAWADVTLVGGEQQFAMSDLAPHGAANMNKTESLQAVVDGYHFTLAFDKPLIVSAESMGTIAIADKHGNPVTSLAPVMGSYSHIVGFYDDFRTVIHTHPMGPEPTKSSDHGGPDLMFHLIPQKSGYVKLFAQVSIGGKMLMVPFVVAVKPAK